MSTFSKTILSVLTAWTLIIGGFVIHTLNTINAEAQAPVSGSVAMGNDYRLYTASSTSASANTPIILKTRPGSLAQVTIASTTAGSVFRLYDSASATSAPALITSFPVSPTAGTYTFDVSFNNGLVLEVPTGFAGIYTVSYR